MGVKPIDWHGELFVDLGVAGSLKRYSARGPKRGSSTEMVTEDPGVAGESVADRHAVRAWTLARSSVSLSEVTVAPQSSAEAGHPCATEGAAGGFVVVSQAPNVKIDAVASNRIAETLRVPPKCHIG